MSDERFLWPGSPNEQAPPAFTPGGGGRRRVVLAGAIALAAAGVVALVLVLAGGDAPPGSLSSNAVVRAASATNAQAGYQFAMDIGVTVAGRSVAIQATGVVTERPQVVLSMDMAIAGATYTAVFAPPWEYIQAGGNWFKIDRDSYEQAIGAGGLSPTNNDPSQLLHFLAATGTVTRVGTEAIRGVQTTHYHAVTELSRYAATVPASERQAAAASIATLERDLSATTLPIDAWVDDQQRVRRISFAASGICTTSGPADEAITMDFFDYGPQAAPAIPSDAADITSQAARAAAAGNQQTPCSA